MNITMTFNFLDPAGGAKAEQFDIAPKLESLQGKRLGLLDNSKTNAEKYLKMVGKILVDRYGVAEVKLFRKDALSKPAPAEVLDELVANCDFAVTGIGDCGSCSTNSVHDGIEIETRGIPAVAVCTEAFLPGLAALPQLRGMPEYHFAVVPHQPGVTVHDATHKTPRLTSRNVA